MAVFNMLGGYSLAEADDVRRIMGKYYRMKGGVARQMLDVYQRALRRERRLDLPRRADDGPADLGLLR
jgi:DNA polymerase III alpha subunit